MAIQARCGWVMTYPNVWIIHRGARIVRIFAHEIDAIAYQAMYHDARCVVRELDDFTLKLLIEQIKTQDKENTREV